MLALYLVFGGGFSVGIWSLDSRWMVSVDVVIGSRFFGVVWTTYLGGGRKCVLVLITQWPLLEACGSSAV